MNFSKAKSFLIIMFLLLDIYLIFNYVVNNAPDLYEKNETFNQTVEILEKHNITIDKSITSFEKPNLHNLNLINNSYNKEKFAKKILGDFKISEESTYVSPKGKLVFKEGSYTYYPAEKIEIDALLPSHKTSEIVIKQLKNMGFETRYLKWVSSFEEEKGLFKITYSQSFFEKELFLSPVTVYVTEKGIEKLSGSIYTPEVLSAENNKLKDKSEILIKITNVLNDRKKNYHISKLEDGYFIESDLFISSSASPALKVTLQSGDVYYFDYTTANLLKKEKFSLD